MKILVFSTVKPNRKNLRVKYFQLLIEAIRKKTPVKLIWLVYSPEKFESIHSSNESVIDIHEFSNALELVKKIDPTLILISVGSEPIQYSASLAGKFLNIPVVSFSGAKIDFRSTTSTKKNQTFGRFISKKLPTEEKQQEQFLRRFRFFIYKYLFMLKTKIVTKQKLTKIFTSLITDFQIYFFDKPIPYNNLPDLHLLHHPYQIRIFNQKEISENLVVIGNILLDNIPTSVTKHNDRKNLKILLVTDSLLEHGLWSEKQKINFLKELFQILKNNNFEFSIKIHPTSENLDEYRQITKNFGINVKIFQMEDIWKILPDYELVISFGFSNSHTELSFAGQKLIILNPNQEFPLMDLVEEGKSCGHVMNCSDFSDLPSLIHKLNKKEVTLTDEFLKARNELFYKNDGKSAERGSEAILNLLKIS